MTAVDVLIPVMDRPHRVGPLLKSAWDSQQDAILLVLFLVNADDTAEISALRHAGAPFLIVSDYRRPGDFSRKINTGIRKTSAEWVFAGADDLEFTLGWADEAIRVSEQTGCRFVAVNDQANPEVIRGRHATHPLVHRSYIEECGTIDEPGKLYCELYDHQCVDNEATATAKCREEFVAAPRSVVRHMHPIFDRSVSGDETYRVGQAHGREDRALYLERSRLFT